MGMGHWEFHGRRTTRDFNGEGRDDQEVHWRRVTRDLIGQELPGISLERDDQGFHWIGITKDITWEV